MPKKRADGIRWLPIGAARPGRVAFALHNPRAIILGPARRAQSSRGCQEAWRPVSGRPLRETTAERAERAARTFAVAAPCNCPLHRGTPAPMGKKARQQITGTDAGALRGTAGRRGYEERCNRNRVDERGSATREVASYTAEQWREIDRKRSKRERAAARLRDQQRAREVGSAALPAATTAPPLSPLPPTPQPRPPRVSADPGAPQAPVPQPAAPQPLMTPPSLARPAIPPLPPVLPLPGLMPTFIAPSQPRR